MERIPDIEARIEEAEDKTRQAEQNLAGAEADAIMARDIAKEAESIAKMASDVSLFPMSQNGSSLQAKNRLQKHQLNDSFYGLGCKLFSLIIKRRKSVWSDTLMILN